MIIFGLFTKKNIETLHPTVFENSLSDVEIYENFSFYEKDNFTKKKKIF